MNLRLAALVSLVFMLTSCSNNPGRGRNDASGSAVAMPGIVGRPTTASPMVFGDPTTVTIGADRRIELVSIVCRLAGYPEYSVDWPLRYFNEIEKWFAPFAQHPAVRMARRLLSEDGIGYNAPLSLVLHADPFTLRPLLPLDPLPERLDNRWTAGTAEAFLSVLADFSRDSGFTAFFDSHGYLYNEVGERIAGLVRTDSHVSWLEDFFGMPCSAERNIIVSFLTGFRHYGLSMRLATGCLSLNPVLGVTYWSHAEFRAMSPLLSAIIIHEFSHGYVDALVDEVWDALNPHMAKLTMERWGTLPAVYAGGTSLAYETMVRACDSWFTLVRYGDEELGRILALHESQGFDLVRDLVPLMARYSENRSSYPEFRNFMPEMVEYFKTKAAGESAGSVGKPAGTDGEPAGTVDEPAGTVGKPAGTVGKPAGTVGEPAGTVGKPS